MSRALPVVLLLGLLAACVTINVYFPAAAAEKAADRIIDGVLDAGAGAAPAKPEAPPQSSLPPPAVAAIMDFLIGRAEAQEPNLDVSSPEVQRLTSSMEARSPQLAPHFASGAVGFTGDGLLAVRDANAVPLAQRNPVKSLVEAENADRKALYRAIAVANNHPEWEAQIQSTFAKRWVAKAKGGWWYQEGGAWKQK